MNILGYNLLPKPLARNVTVSPTPRALGLFSFTKSLFLRRAAAYLHSPLVVLATNRQPPTHSFLLFCVWARRQGRRTNQPPRGNG